MADNTIPELTDQQIELAQAFNLADQILRDLFLSTKGDLKFPKSLYVDGHPDFDTPNLSPAELKYF